jgi:hypothetical protein
MSHESHDNAGQSPWHRSVWLNNPDNNKSYFEDFLETIHHAITKYELGSRQHCQIDHELNIGSNVFDWPMLVSNLSRIRW